MTERLKRASVTAAILYLTAALFASSAIAGDPAKTFDELYSADIKKIKAPKDSVDFSQKLLDNAGKVQDDPELKEYILNKASEYAMKDPSGFPFAVKAVETLASSFEAKKDLYQEKLLGLYQARYDKSVKTDKATAGDDYIRQLMARGKDILMSASQSGTPASASDSQPVQTQPAGVNIDVDAINAAMKYFNQARTVATAIRSQQLDDITQYIKSAAGRLDLKKRYDDLSSKLSSKPGDSILARSLAMLCLLELDDPPSATRFSTICNEESLKLYIPLAAKPLADIPENICMELALWYKTLATGTGSQICKIIAYNRCKSYLSRFLTLHQKSDGDQLKAQNALTEVNTEIAKLDPAGKSAVGAAPVKVNLLQKVGVIWNYETGANKADRLVCSPDGKKLAVFNRLSFCTVFDVETKKEIFKTDKYSFGEIFTENSKFLLAASDPIGIFETDTGKQLGKDGRRTGMANDCPAFSADGKLHCGFKWDKCKEATIMEVQTGKRIKEIPLNPKGAVVEPAAAFSPDGKLLAVSGKDNGEDVGKQRFCRIIDLETEKTIQELTCSQELQNTGFQGFNLSFLSDGKRLVAISSCNWLAIWDARSGKSLLELKKASWRWFAISPDGKKIAAANYEQVDIIDPANGNVIQTIKPEAPKKGRFLLTGTAMSFLPDDQYLFLGYDITNTETGGDPSSGVFLIGLNK